MHFYIFPNLLQCYEIKIFEIPLILFFLYCEDSLSGVVCLQKREGDPIYDCHFSIKENIHI